MSEASVLGISPVFACSDYRLTSNAMVSENKNPQLVENVPM